MKKRILSVLLSGVMILSLVACSGNEGSEDEKENGSEQTEETTKEDSDKEIAFDEITVVDNEACKIVITELDPDSSWGYTVKAQMENKSSDVTYMFSVDSAPVNGVQTDPFFATEVAAGKKSNEEISFMDAALNENNVGDFTDIELNFRVYDSNNWEAEDVANESVHIYPYGEEKAVQYVREPADTDNIIVDTEYLTITVIDGDMDDYGDYVLNMYIQNKCDSDLMVSIDEASINGFMIDPFWASSVKAGKCEFAQVSWLGSDLDTNGITEVTDVEFKITSYKDGSDYSGENLVDQIVNIQL